MKIKKIKKRVAKDRKKKEKARNNNRRLKRVWLIFVFICGQTFDACLFSLGLYKNLCFSFGWLMITSCADSSGAILRSVWRRQAAHEIISREISLAMVRQFFQMTCDPLFVGRSFFRTRNFDMIKVGNRTRVHWRLMRVAGFIFTSTWGKS